MASMRLWQHKNGYWYITFNRGRHKSLKTTDEKKANDVFSELEKEDLKSRIIKLEKKELKSLSDFKKEYLLTRKSKKKNTYRADILALTKFEEFYGNKSMAGITDLKLAQFRTTLKLEGKIVKDKKKKTVSRTQLKDSSCNTIIRHLKIALKEGIKWGYINKQNLDISELKLFKVDKRKPVYMTKDDMRKLMSVAEQDPIMKVPIAIQLYTGMSRAEVISPINIEDEHITYKRVKTQKIIRVNIADGLKPYIAHLPKGIQRVFPWKNERTYSRYFERIVKKAELEGISPHKVRHSFATLLLQEGEDLKTISELLGHSSISITADFYTHITDEHKKKAVNKVKF